MGFYKYDRSQLILFAHHIDERLPVVDKARFVVKLVSQLKLEKLLSRYSRQGNDAYPPEVMLAVWFYAYSEGISSTRKVEELCKYDVRYIYLSADLRPDHCSLSRFRKAHLDLMSEYFLQLILFARAAGISNFKELNIDSTQLKGACSKKKCKNSDDLDKFIERVREDIREYMKRCELAEAGELQEEVDIEEIRGEIQRLKELEEQLLHHSEQLESRKETLKAEHRSKHQINLTDPDARLMPKLKDVGYNAHAAVDSESHLVVAAEVFNEPNEQNHYSIMHEKCDESLGVDKERKENLDGGYHSSEQLRYAEENGIDVVIADPTPLNRSRSSHPTNMNELLAEERRLERCDFSYDGEGDVYRCPAGKQLTYVGNYHKGRIYQSPGCEGCPLFARCLPKNSQSGVRRIYRSELEVYAERMHDKLQTDEAKERLKRRMSTVEPVFGNIKHNLGFRAFCLRGLLQVRGEFTLMCIAHNINVLYKLLGEGFLSSIFFAQYIAYYANSVLSKIRWLIMLVILSEFGCRITVADLSRPRRFATACAAGVRYLSQRDHVVIN